MATAAETQAASSSETSRLLFSKLSAAKDYSTFLLGMAEHDPPVVVTPSKGHARISRPSRDHHGEDSDHGEDGPADAARQVDNAGTSSRPNIKGDYNPIVTFWKGVRTNYDLRLDNVGSVARDHLANERTFLAWMRSGCERVASTCVLTDSCPVSPCSESCPVQYRRSYNSALPPDFVELYSSIAPRTGCFHYHSGSSLSDA